MRVADRDATFTLYSIDKNSWYTSIEYEHSYSLVPDAMICVSYKDVTHITCYFRSLICLVGTYLIYYAQ